MQKPALKSIMGILAKFCSSHIRLLLRSPIAQEIGPKLQITQLCQATSCYHVRERMTHGRATSDIVLRRNWKILQCAKKILSTDRKKFFPNGASRIQSLPPLSYWGEGRLSQEFTRTLLMLLLTGSPQDTKSRNVMIQIPALLRSM